ncbi:hypothetical protein ACI65C_003878 [Semiaphis heraclei]
MEYDKERLIEIVHSKPALWDKRTSQYQNRNLKQKEWKDVNKILGENEAKEKLENTRDIFRREFNKSIKSSGQGTDEAYKNITLTENDVDSENPDDLIESPPETLENVDISKPITHISNKRKTFQEEALEVEKKRLNFLRLV